MMERFNNMFRDDPAPTEGVGRMIDNEEDMKVALGDAMAMGGDILENFLQSELPDLLAIAEKDPNFGNVLANAIKDYPSVLGMMAPKPDMDEVRGNMGRMSAEESTPQGFQESLMDPAMRVLNFDPVKTMVLLTGIFPQVQKVGMVWNRCLWSTLLEVM